MKPFRWVAGTVLIGLLAWALIFAYRRGRAERDSEVQREQPVVAPSRVKQEEGGMVVRLDSSDARAFGIVVEPARAIAAPPTVTLSGIIIPDSSRIGFLRAPVAGRLDVAPGTSWPELGTHVDGGTVLAVVADAKPLTLSRGGTVTEVGARPGEVVQPGQVLLAISDVTQPLVRIAWADDAPASAPKGLVVQPVDRRASASARLLGPALEVDPLTQRPAYYYRLEHTWPGLAVGLPVVASVPIGPAEPGAVVVPTAAVVQWEGLTWAFVQREPGVFSRVAVPVDRPVPLGWAVRAGISPGENIVTRGAEQLLSEEFRAEVKVGDEVEE
jgi:biotin carboxyl carrier protein